MALQHTFRLDYVLSSPPKDYSRVTDIPALASASAAARIFSLGGGLHTLTVTTNISCSSSGPLSQSHFLRVPFQVCFSSCSSSYLIDSHHSNHAPSCSFFFSFSWKRVVSDKQVDGFTSNVATTSPKLEALKSHDRNTMRGGEESSDTDDDDDCDNYSSNDPYLMDTEERREWRRKIREVMDGYPNVQDQMKELDPEERRLKLQKLMADYPLVADEDDPDWPEDAADGWGFNLGQFFNKITIKNVKKDTDDYNYDSENEIVWQDDNYIRPIKDISSADWEEAVFKDISPLVILVHNRYKRPKENEKIRDELEKSIHIIWNCRLPSPRCVAIDAVIDDNLVSALKVSIFPEIIFTKAGKILYREKAIRTADELSKIMAYFYYGAAKPPCLTITEDSQEVVPSLTMGEQ